MNEYTNGEKVIHATEKAFLLIYSKYGFKPVEKERKKEEVTSEENEKETKEDKKVSNKGRGAKKN